MKLVLLSCVAFVVSASAAEQPASGPEAWKGGSPDSTYRQVWPQSVCWRHGQKTTLACTFDQPEDWSRFDTAAFWLHAENATGSSFVVLFTSENPQTQGPDYYAYKITLDWIGWKRFVLPFLELNVARQPIGWKQIDSVCFTASGYGSTPDPNAVVRLDGFELLAAGSTGPRMTDADLFAALDLGLPALTAVRQAVDAGDLAAAKSALAAHLRNRTTPRWLADWRQPAFRDAKAKPRDVAAAEKVLQHKFDYPTGPSQLGTWDFGAKIDWTANPTEGEARTHLWNEALNRHFHFRTLAEAYWQTGQDKYAQEIAAEIVDWAASNPAVLLSDGNHLANGCEAWQTLTTGIRLADTWPNALYRCLGSPAFGDEAICVVFKSVFEQASHLSRWPSTGNWLTAESNGLFTAGVLFPEFKEAGQWRQLALERLYRQLDEDVYPDGMQYELAAGYNNWVVTEFAHILELADLNGLRHEVPDDFLAKMEKMFNYLLLAALPNGQIPGLNDANNADVRSLLATGCKLFPRRTDFEFVATGGQSGTAPAETSHAFPYTGHYVMRSGWDREATYLLFDAGPFGAGHQHEDKLHFVLWSHGHQLVLDPGNYSYDRSRWRRYVLSTAAHNTVLVDNQGQHRAGHRDTYFWPRPWTAPAPVDSGVRWRSTSEYDCATGLYSHGYGPQNAVNATHERRIVLVKSARLFVVTDILTPRDDAEHEYTALFHLDAANAVVDEKTKAVSSEQAECGRLRIIPVADERLAVEIVNGRDEEPVQGWAGQPWRAIPTALYRRSGRGVVRFQFVLEPGAQAGPSAVRAVESAAASAGDVVTRIRFVDDRVLEISPPDASGAVACSWSKPSASVRLEGATPDT